MQTTKFTSLLPIRSINYHLPLPSQILHPLHHHFTMHIFQPSYRNSATILAKVFSHFALIVLPCIFESQVHAPLVLQ